MKRLTEITKETRKALKAEFPECKFSVTTKNGLSISAHLMSAPASPFASLDYISSHYEQYPASHDGKDAQLNHYYINQDNLGRWASNCVHLTEKAAKMLIRVTEIANADNYDNSDHMTDYFDVGFYFHLEIGKWNKPFVIK